MADYDIIIKAQDKSGATLKKVDKNLQKIEKSSGGVTKALGLAGGALAAIGAGQILKGIVNQYTAFEKFRTVLAVYTGSQKAANDELKRLDTLSKSLPQTLNDLTEGFVLFKSRGIDTSTEALRAFSNIATANQKSMTQLGEAVADALTGEYERLKEFGIRVSKDNGKFTADVVGGQQIIANSSAELVKKLTALGEVGGKFGKAAEFNNQTLAQSFSNLDGSISRTAIEIGENLRPEMKKAVDQLTEWIDKNDELAAKIGVGLGDAVGAVAAGVTILADNIDLIRQAAIAYLGVRFAGAFVNLAVRMSSAVKATQSLGGMFGTMGKVVRTVVSGPLLKLATMLGKGGMIGIAITAVLWLFDKFKLDMFTIGESSTNMARLVNGAWQLIVQGATTAVEYLSGLWNTFSEGFSNIFLNSENMFGKTMSAIADLAKKYINFVIGNWVALGKTIYAIITNFPKWFMDSMKGIMSIADDFGNSIIEKFSNIGTAIKQAMAGDFADAWDTIGKESAFSFEKSWNSAFKNSTGLLDGVDYGEIYGTDYLTGGIDYVKAKAEDVVKILNNASIMPRIGTGSPTAGAPIPAPVAGTTAITEALKKEVAVTDMLKKQYMDLGSLRSQGVAGAEAARALENTIQAYREYGYARQDADEAATKSADEYQKKLIAGHKLYGEMRNEALETADTVGDAWKEMSKGMAASMTQGIMSGKGLFNSFGDFMENWAKKMLADVIEKQLMQPMVDQMGKWMGDLFGGKEATAGATNLTGTMNSLLGGLGNSLTGLFDNMSSGMGGLFSGLGDTLGGLFGGGGGGGIMDMFGGLFGGGGGGGIMDIFSGFFANGGYIPSGKVGIAGEAGAELITGPANVTPLNGEIGASSGGPNVTINIQAIDTQSGTQFLLDHKREVEGIIHNAYSRRGKQGIYN